MQSALIKLKERRHNEKHPLPLSPRQNLSFPQSCHLTYSNVICTVISHYGPSKRWFKVFENCSIVVRTSQDRKVISGRFARLEPYDTTEQSRVAGEPAREPGRCCV